ncbi:MAG: HEAT repeat domain-containing protein [Chloroflexota bacterium]
MSAVSELITELKQETKYDERQKIALQIQSFGMEAVEELINVLRLVPDSNTYFDEKDMNLANLHSIAEDAIVSMGRDSINSLLPLLREKNWGARHGALWCLKMFKDENTITPLIELLSISDDHNTILECCEVLEAIGKKSYKPLLDATHSDNSLLRKNAVTCLASFHDKTIAQRLIEMASHDDCDEVRLNALALMENYESDATQKVLTKLVSDANSEISELAQEILKEQSQ